MSDQPIASSLLRQEGPQQELLSVNEFRRELFDKMEVYRVAAESVIPVRKAIVQQQCLDFMADIYAAAQARIVVLEGSIDYLRNVIDHPVKQEMKKI